MTLWIDSYTVDAMYTTQMFYAFVSGRTFGSTVVAVYSPEIRR